MPYRRRGKQVQVKKGGAWRTLKTHRTVAQAQAHLAALNINVMGKHHRKRR